MLTLSRLSLAAVLLALPLVVAQDTTQQTAPAQTGEVEGGGAPSPENIPGPEDKPGDETADNYPTWVTNDYPCGKLSSESRVSMSRCLGVLV